MNHEWDLATFIDAVNAALPSENRPTMNALKGTLGELNNAGCDIDAHGNPV